MSKRQREPDLQGPEAALRIMLSNAAANNDFVLIVQIVTCTELSFDTLCELQRVMRVSIARMHAEFERETAEFIASLALRK